MKVCTKCGKSDGDFYIRTDLKKPTASSWCKRCLKNHSNTKKISAWRHRKKIRAVEYKGGKCEHCGYNRCLQALQFHHRDPELKDFGIASARSWTWERLEEELDKCILLCANCHAEEHEKVFNRSQVLR